MVFLWNSACIFLTLTLTKASTEYWTRSLFPCDRRMWSLKRNTRKAAQTDSHGAMIWRALISGMLPNFKNKTETRLKRGWNAIFSGTGWPPAESQKSQEIQGGPPSKAGHLLIARDLIRGVLHKKEEILESMGTAVWSVPIGHTQMQWCRWSIRRWRVVGV